MCRPSSGEQDDYIISKETSESSMCGRDWLQERIWWPTLHLDIHCHGCVYQICPTIRWFVEAPRKEWKTEMWLYHAKRHVKMESGYWRGNIPRCLLVSITFLFLTPLTNVLNEQVKVKKSVINSIWMACSCCPEMNWVIAGVNHCQNI